MAKIDGVAIGSVVAGTAFVYSGLTGRSLLASIQAIITGKAPSSVPVANPITGQDSSNSTATGSSAAQSFSASGLTNPIGPGAHRGRIDEGVDFSGDFNLYAMGPGIITEVSGSGWPGGIFINLKMDNGQDIYYAENITPMVHVGQKVQGGDLIGHAHNTFPFIEIGFGTGANQTAAASSHYTEGQATAEGQQMAALLTSLGAP
jgi:murein DD-endopeptidase MepM/ murein hydrolase activator NlpD